MSEFKIEDNMLVYFNKSYLYYKRYIRNFDLDILEYEQLELKFVEIFSESWETWNGNTESGFYMNFKMRLVWRFPRWYNNFKDNFVQSDFIGEDDLTYEFKYPKIKNINDGFEKILNEDMLNILNLHFDGFKYEEIADKLNCSITTVERRMKQIRDIIKDNEHLFI